MVGAVGGLSHLSVINVLGPRLLTVLITSSRRLAYVSPGMRWCADDLTGLLPPNPSMPSNDDPRKRPEA
jgi:hypothetical protein